MLLRKKILRRPKKKFIPKIEVVNLEVKLKDGSEGTVQLNIA